MSSEKFTCMRIFPVALNPVICQPMSIRPTIVSILLVLSCLSGFSADPVKFKNVQLPPLSHSVYMVHRDNFGLLWLGTSEGLYSYDGYSLCPVFRRGTVSNTHVHAMSETASGFYIGTDNGLLQFDRQKRTTDAVPGSPRDVRAIFPESDGKLLVGSLNGLYRFDPADGSIRNISRGLPHEAVYAIAADGRNYYVGTYNGMGLLRQGGDSVEKFDPGFGQDGLSKDLFVNCIALDSVGRKLYIGAGRDLYSYDLDDRSLLKVDGFSGTQIKTVAVSDKGHIFAGTDNGLIYRSPDGLVRVCRHDSRDGSSLPNNIVWSLSLDDDMNLWIATDYGLAQLSFDTPYRFIPLSEITGSGDGNVIQTIMRLDRENLWLGGSNGLIICDLTENRSRWYKPSDSDWVISHNVVRSIFRDSAGQVWIATDGSVSRYDARSRLLENYMIWDRDHLRNANWSYSIVDDLDGRIWIGSYLGGVFVVDKNKFDSGGKELVADYNFNHINGLPNDFVRQLIRDGRGNIFVINFAASDIVRINPRTFETIRYSVDKDRETLPSLIMTDDSGDVWVGFSGGIGKINQSEGRVEKYIFPVEYPVDPLSMAIVSDKFWVTTTAGVWQFDPQTGRFGKVRLPDTVFNCIYKDLLSSYVILGAVDGVVSVSPDYTGDSIAGIRHRLNVTSVKVNGMSLDGIDPMAIKKLDLDHDRNYVEICFSDLSFMPETHPRIMYRLNGGGMSGAFQMLEPGSNTVALSRLRPGKYTLEVGTVGDGESMLELPIYVRPPWYLSTLAKIIYLIVLAGIIFILFRYRHNQERQRRERKEREETIKRVKNRMDFLTNISHELKSPLSMVIGPVSHLLTQTRDPEMKRRLDVIHKNAVSLDHMLHRALEMNRIDKDDDSFMITSEIEIVGFCRSILDNYSENNPDKRFVFSSDVGSLVISVDVVKIESVVNNLISNACKYSPHQSTIAFSVILTDSDLCLKVSDDGIGIPASERALVFQRLFRSTNAADVDGTGIGLYLTKKYVEMHKGHIYVDENGSGGTVFTVSLPLQPISSAVTDDSTAVVTSNMDRRPVVLVVEDSADIAKFVEDILRKEFRCIIAGNGRAGLAVLATVVPDLIIADIMMPVMDGLEMIRLIKKNVKFSSIPVIMLTARDDSETQRECYEAGADGFVPKPFDASVVISRVRQMLKSRQRITSTVKAEILSTPRSAAAESHDEKVMKQISRLIDDNLSDSCLNVTFIAEKLSMSTKQLYRLVKKYVGVSPVDLIRTMRLRKAAMLLRQKKFTVAEVMYMTGFNSASYFSKCFVGQYGMTPKAYMESDD